MTTVSGFIAGPICSSTPSTAASSASTRCTREAAATASRGALATRAPCGSSARALDAVRFQTVTRVPDASARSTIPEPSTPVPRNAACSTHHLRKRTLYKLRPPQVGTALSTPLALDGDRSAPGGLVASRVRARDGDGIGPAVALARAVRAQLNVMRVDDDEARRIGIRALKRDRPTAAGDGRRPRVAARHRQHARRIDAVVGLLVIDGDVDEVATHARWRGCEHESVDRRRFPVHDRDAERTRRRIARGGRGPPWNRWRAGAGTPTRPRRLHDGDLG